MENKAFEIVTSNLEPYITGKGLTKTSQEEKTTLYTGEDKAIKLTYDSEKKSFILEASTVNQGEIEDDWRSVALWLFDPAQHNEKDAKTIAIDFEDSLRELYEKKSRPTTLLDRAQRARQSGGKSRTSDDPAGLVSRLSNEFTDLKEPYKAHMELYGELLPDTFLTEHFNPLMKSLLNQSKMEKKTKKLFSILEDKYINGTNEVKSIITMTILSSIDRESPEGIKAAEYMSPTLKTAWRYALKYGIKKLNK